MRWRTLHPFGLCLFPVVHLGATNLTEIEPAALLAPAVIALVAAGIVLAAFRLACGELERAAVLTSWIVVVFFSYGPVFEAVFARGLFETPATAHAVLLTSVAVTAAAGVAFLWRRPVDLAPLSSGLAVAASLLLGSSALLGWLAHDPVP